MEINEYRPKQSRLHKTAASEYEASQVKAQQIKPYLQDQKSVQINKNEHPIIKGEIIDLRYQEVKIRLDPSGQIINAKLSGELPLSIGQTAEFEVSDVIDGQITLRYITTGNLPMVDIIHKALYASGLTISERNLAIVEELLNYQMPVDKNTILQLIKLSTAYPNVSLATLILMHKNSLPINIGSIAQFEAYQKGIHQILNQLNSLIGNINSIASDNSIEVMDQANSQGNIKSDSIPSGIIPPANLSLDKIHTNNTHLNSVLNLHKELLTLLIDEESRQELISPDVTIGHVLSDNELIQLKDTLIIKINESTYYSGEIAENFKSQLSNGSMTLESLLSIVHDLYGSESLQPHVENSLLSTRIASAFISMSEQLSYTAREKLVHLLKSDAYREIIRETLHNRWTLSPSELTLENKVKEFFRRLDKDMEQLDKLSENYKMPTTLDFKASINKLQDNLQFMRDLNELLLYIQLPIRLTEEDVHGDLYVFTRKNKKHVDTDRLNILLHLNMANLGPIDIHMSMLNRQLNVVFYLEKPSEQIISKHLHELVDALNDKGYQLQARTQISDSKPDFIRDILQEDAPSSNPHRYTFDIRA
ncbi:MAG: flagellar hook-length control protein FliK [Anaerolineaceae bacterium]|nr:MAG: flagellar hook-length control protein FliK [Anaerolineaceae bacterium]